MATQGRTLALFPGAFRPPHAAHFAAVLDLAQRPKVDEVVIIIANRNRTLPGTTLALDATVAQEIWSRYLDAVDQYPALANVRTEIAPHTAIQHATAYLDRAAPGDTLYFCIGERDLIEGDERFANLAEGAAQRGVRALITPAPTGDFAIRATDLRHYLTVDTDGRTKFMAALPHHLSTAQKEAIWERCSVGLCDITELLRGKVRMILQENQFATEPALEIVRTGKIDPVFRLQQPDGRKLYIKYAGDTVENDSVGNPLQPKPRRRLATERRALSYLHKEFDDNTVALPEILLFDKVTRTLVLSEVCPGGHSLHEELAHGHFNPAIAAATGDFLAHAHRPTAALRPFWGEAETDLAHWQRMLALRTVEIDSIELPAVIHTQLAQLQAWSDAERRPGFFHLDFVPKNIRIGVEKMSKRKHVKEIGVIDYEFCANVGDPAYELGLLLGHYLFWAIALEQPEQYQQATQAFIKRYSQHSSAEWSTLVERTIAFSGAGLLCMLVSGPKVTAAIRSRLVAIATTLLAQKYPLNISQ